MLAIDFLKDPSNVEFRGIYVLFGEDFYLRSESAVTIRKLVLPDSDDLAVARFQGSAASLADVLDELRTLPFFSKQRFVIVEEADPFVTAHRKELEAWVASGKSAGVLLLEVKSWTSTTNLAKLVEKNGLSIDCRGPKEGVLLSWISQFAKSRYHVQFDSGAAELLLELVGPEVGLLVAELEKLSIYVGGKGKVHREDVAKMVGAGRIETVWKVIDAATTGRGALALEHLDGLLNAGEPHVKLIAAMSFSLMKVYRAGALRRRKMDIRDACSAVGIPPFGVETTRQQHAHLGPDRVDRLPATLLKADLDLKGASPLPPRAVLERFLVELSTPRRD